jgi:lipoate-protein ligase A
MLFINNTSISPYFNLSAEEYLLKYMNEDIIMLWQNEPSIIIGKNQHLESEINEEFVKEKRLKVVRRLSGGGAVYHDLGNLNITFFQSSKEIDFMKYTKKIQELLNTIGVNAIADHRQGLTINGLKISGSAQCIHRGRAIFHATLLFESNLDNLNVALQSSERSLTDEKYVKSIRSSVTNIKDNIPVPLSISEFKIIIKEFFLNNNNLSSIYTFTNSDRAAIEKLANEKYSTIDWNFHKNNKICLDLK